MCLTNTKGDLSEIFIYLRKIICAIYIRSLVSSEKPIVVLIYIIGQPSDNFMCSKIAEILCIENSSVRRKCMIFFSDLYTYNIRVKMIVLTIAKNNWIIHIVHTVFSQMIGSIYLLVSLGADVI